MTKLRMKKKHRILWVPATGEILCEIEAENTKSVTECWRDDVQIFEDDNKEGVINKVEELKLKKAKKYRRTDFNGCLIDKDGNFIDEDYKPTASPVPFKTDDLTNEVVH